MFYLQKDDYLVTMNRFDSQSGWGELLIDKVHFFRQPVIGGQYHFKTIGSVWLHWNGVICFYLPNTKILEDPAILITDVLRELYKNGITAPSVAYDTFPPQQAILEATLNSKTYKGIPPFRS